MRLLRMTGILMLTFLVLTVLATAGEKDLGVSNLARITFHTPVRVGTAVLPAGEYTIRHTMEGTDHVMVFKLANGKGAEVKAKCALIQLGNKADQTRTVYEVNAANERVLRELVFRGDTAKHVF
jgi:hypothetical protein